MHERTLQVYAARAAEYTAQLGSMETVHSSDATLVTDWADRLDGAILDAGCGPGHWTAHLASRRGEARGIDQVPEFVEHARAAHPDVAFDLGSIDDLPYPDAGLAGVLAWYSLIHHVPEAISRPLSEFARVIQPGGGLLVGFFTGDEIEPFDHAVTTAYRWPPSELADAIRRAGFDIVETHTRSAATPRPRPHGAVIARRV